MRTPLALLGLALAACATRPPPVPLEPGLAAHAGSFHRALIRAAPGVHVAVGFGLANSVLLEGTDGVVIVDAMESAEAAAEVRRAFDGVTRAPVRALIYTHNHADHIFGAAVLAGSARRASGLEVHAHSSLLPELERTTALLRPAIYRRSMRQFGALLPDGTEAGVGIGPRLRFGSRPTLAFLPPTHTFSGARRALRLAGLELVLLHAPGETDDQLVVWLPGPRVLIAADNFYPAFPNLYAIRGTSYRDPLRWVASLDLMRALRPLHLVPLHGQPLAGEATIAAALTAYRDAIQLVHDQTVRGLNAGLTPDELVERVRLPRHLARLPFLQERYGSVAWSVRGIYAGYLGWFDGDAAHLSPLPPREHARRLAALAGGEEPLLARAREALDGGDPRWALELASALLQLRPGSQPARALRARALTLLGAASGNANARNYLLTQALEARGALRLGLAPAGDRALVHALPLRAFFRALATSLDPEASASVERVVGFVFPDAGEAWTVHVRRGVAEVQPRLDPAATITVTTDAWRFKELLAGLRGPLGDYLGRHLRVRGSLWQLLGFLRLFSPPG